MNKTDTNGKNRIAQLFKVRQKIQALKELETELAKEALDHLKQYGTLKQDEWSAAVTVTESRRPKWKEEFIKECGKEKADTITANTEPTKSEKVVIFKDGIKVG